MRILFIFIDGLGIGKFDPEINPCTNSQLKLFNNFSDHSRDIELPFGGLIKSIDATLGIPGLPQSATGQTALLTGINAAKLLGRHLNGFPNRKLREIIEQESLFKKLKQLGKKAAFINAYRPIFFEHGPEALIRFLSVTSIANWKAGLKFFSLDDLRAEQSIYHDFTNSELIKRGFDVPVFSAEKAGTILAKTSISFDFCLYEYFKTDKVGHAQNMENAIYLLQRLEKFILSIIVNTDLNNSLIIVTSDHGNIEDLSVKTHTRNNVPFMVWGKNNKKVLKQIFMIQDITKTLLKFTY